MENKKNDPTFDSERKIYFSQSVKAGKRIYYLDVKKNKYDELFLSITESKKIFVGDIDDGQVNFEKHKIFLYREDFGKFIDALSNAIRFIHENSDPSEFPLPGEDALYAGSPAPSDDDTFAPAPAVADDDVPGNEKADETTEGIELNIDF